MSRDYNLKISAKSSRKTGDEFIKETIYLADMADCIEIDFHYPHNHNFENEIEFLKKVAREHQPLTDLAEVLHYLIPLTSLI